MRRNLVDVLCAIGISAIVIFLGVMGEKPKSDTEVRHRHGLTDFAVFKMTGIFGILEFFCAALGAVKLVRCAVDTRESKLASPALLSGIRKQLDEGQIDQ